MLDAVVDYLPSPLDIPPVEGTDVDDPEKTLIRHASDSEPFSALVFKIMTDPYVGQLAFFRVYSGTLKSGDSVYNVAKRRKERIGRLLRMHANKREEIQEILAGDICAAVGLRTVSTGDTICDDEHPIVLESIDFPTPVIQLAVEPKTKADQEKLGMAIQKLAQEDPTFRVNTDPETGQTILSGMGELHLEIIVDRMMREFGVGANVGKPQVAYRETIRKHAEARRAAREADRRPRPVRPREDPGGAAAAGPGFEFVNEVSGGTVPKEYIKPTEVGIKEALEGGILAGYPMSDIKVTLYDGSYHEVDSSEMAFKIAGSLAIKEAVQQGQAGAAGADHGGGSGGAGAVHGRRHRRPEFAARAHRGHAVARDHADHQGDRCRFRKCSATRPSCDRARRAAAASPCISAGTKRFRAGSPRRS